jgi:hypothetical protein
LVAAVLVFSAFAFARPLVLTWLGDSSLKAIALQDGTVIDRAVTVQGVTVHLEEGYADAARTVLTMRVSGGDPRHPPSPYMPSMRIVDASGGTYHAITGSGFNDDSLFEFLPLPTDALGAPQTLTFIVGQMQRMTDDLQEVTTFGGPWQITFQLRTQAGRAIALSVPGQQHGGIMMQTERIELAPAGVRLMVRISGVPSDTSLFSLMHFALHGTEIVACPPGQHVCGSTSGGTRDGGRMLLAGPDGRTMPPAWVAVVSPTPSDGVSIGTQAVGPSGTADLEFLFFEPLHVTSGMAHATFDEVRIASAVNTDGEERSIPGPWDFYLPLG